MNEKDIRIDKFTNSSPKIEMRLIHMPTGTFVDGTGTREHKLRKELMEKLKKKLK